MPITKHNFTVRRVEELADTMRSAFRIAQSGLKGPVLVDIPKDVTAAVCEFTPKKPEPIRTVTTFNAEQVKSVSYTHLDVYKRQEQGTIKIEGENHADSG